MTESKSKARKALLDAFNELVLVKPYAQLHLGEILARADVGRSTFYEHFANKEDILRHSLGPVLHPLAAVGVDSRCDSERLLFLLDHFREHRQIARVYLEAPMLAVAESVLSQQVEQLLQGTCSLEKPDRLAAQIAASSLALIRSWLSEEPPSAEDAIAEQLVVSCTALHAAFARH